MLSPKGVEKQATRRGAHTSSTALTGTPCACILSHDLNPPLQNFCHLLLMLLLAVGANARRRRRRAAIEFVLMLRLKAASTASTAKKRRSKKKKA